MRVGASGGGGQPVGGRAGISLEIEGGRFSPPQGRSALYRIASSHSLSTPLPLFFTLLSY